MQIRREMFREADSMAFNGTYNLDLPESGLLQAISLYLSSTQNASALVDVAKWRLIDYISKIELVAGADIVKSLSGKQALAAAYYDTGQIPSANWRSYSSVPHRQNIPLLFGRGYRDTDHALDLARFKNLKLRIANNATSTQFTTDIKLSVVLHYIEDWPGAGALGYYREEEIETWTPVAANTRYVKLPSDLKIRRIMIEGVPSKTAAFKNESSMSRLSNPFKLTTKSGKNILWSGDMDEFMRLVHDIIGFRPRVQMENYNTGGNAFETGVGYVLGAVGAPGTYAAVSAYVDTYLQDDVNDSSQFCNDRVADAPINVVVDGLAFMHHVPIFWSSSPTDEDALDPAVEGQTQVDVTCQSGTTLTGAGAAAVSSVVVSRIVR